MPRGQESRLLCTAKVRPHSRRATGLSPFRGQPGGPRACSQGGRSEWQGTLRSVQGQPPSFQLPVPLRPATAAALDRAALRNGQVPTPAAPHHTLSAPPPSPVTEPRDLPALPSGQRSPLPNVSPSGRVSTHLSRPTRATGSDQQPLPAPALKHVRMRSSRSLLPRPGGQVLSLSSNRRNLPPIFRS